ncbi:MAG: hypothetical protein IT452_10850 [Planctomycetia bacterium]|nr:hypothetical protein [Planctomycetia bacterium]
MTSAEAHYLFRHAMLRDAAYQLQLPSDRCRLHACALEALESVLGGPPPDAPAGERITSESPPHPTDPFARELGEHARLAGTRFREKLLVYLRRAAAFAVRVWRSDEAERLYRESLRLSVETGARRTEGTTLGNLALLYLEAGNAALAESVIRDALAIHREIGLRRFEDIHLCDLGEILVRTGRAGEGMKAWAEGLSILRALGDGRLARRKTGHFREVCARFGVRTPAGDEAGN